MIRHVHLSSPKIRHRPRAPICPRTTRLIRVLLLELQGELEVSGDKYGQPIGRLTIGDTNTIARCVACPTTLPHVYSTLQRQSSFLTSVYYDTFKGKLTLRIGDYLLEGKIANLPKTLVILQRCTCVVPPPTNSHEMPDEDGDDDVDMRHSDDKDNKSTPPAATATSFAIRTLAYKKSSSRSGSHLLSA